VERLEPIGDGHSNSIKAGVAAVRLARILKNPNHTMHTEC
jgi:hypothetical protein